MPFTHVFYKKQAKSKIVISTPSVKFMQFLNDQQDVESLPPSTRQHLILLSSPSLPVIVVGRRGRRRRFQCAAVLPRGRGGTMPSFP